MDGYLLAKTVHVISATVLFGTGLGIAFFFLMGVRGGDPAGAYFAEARLRRYFHWWFALGWPAFVALVAVFWLMVAKPA